MVNTRDGRVTVVVGGEFGSEAKGNGCKWLAERDWEDGHPHVAVRVGGSQAGHTAYDHDGNEWKLRHVPVAAIINPDAKLVIAAGSEIDPEVLLDEIVRLEDAGFSICDRLYVHPSATVITPIHKAIEAEIGLTAKLGSTAKGVGAARADRVMRNATLWGEVSFQTPSGDRLQELSDADLYGWLQQESHVVIEGVQGYGLGIHTPYYPQCTSSDARAIDFLAMAGLSPWSNCISDLRVLVVFRTRPIRVAGNSGPLKGETTWGELGLPEEHTTVTLKVRRVGAEFDWELAENAIVANGGPCFKVSAYVSMLDQIDPAVAGMDWPTLMGSEIVSSFIREFEERLDTTVALVSTGPDAIFPAGTDLI